MADAPFANAGLGMFGNERQFIQAGMTPPDKEGMLKKVLGIMLAGVPLGDEGGAGVAPPAMGQGMSMPAVPGGQGINPNKRSTQGMTPGGFQFPGMPQVPGASAAVTEDDLTSHVDKFWG